jgi:hypothetical protein
MRVSDFGLHVKIMSGGAEAVKDSSHDSDCSRHCWGVRGGGCDGRCGLSWRYERFWSAEKC